MSGYRERLIAARERLGLSRERMAIALLTPRQTYANWENGSRRTPGVAVVAAESLRQGLVSAEVGDAAARHMTASEAAVALGVSEKTVRETARRHKFRLRHVGTARGIDWNAEFARGESITSLAKRLGVSRGSVTDAARRRDHRFPGSPIPATSAK